jgi:hypothetical protein
VGFAARRALLNRSFEFVRFPIRNHYQVVVPAEAGIHLHLAIRETRQDGFRLYSRFALAPGVSFAVRSLRSQSPE